eukprot:scaffold441368_cov33-Prasinocladus_malaysianus.AAC.1
MRFHMIWPTTIYGHGIESKTVHCAYVQGNAVCEVLVNLVEDHKVFLPVYSEVCNPALNAAHWREIFRLMGAEDKFKDGQGYSVSELVALGVLDHLEAVANVAAA